MSIQLKHVFILYETCVKTCQLCDINTRCNSCKEKTEAQWSNIVKFHYGAPISTFTLVSPSTSHSGEKSNKCNQCDYATSKAGYLRKHFKTHRREN